MPLPSNTEERFHEFRHGKTYAKTRQKYGKARANKQMIAVALSGGRKKKGRHRHSGR
jgi:hypothetical protein